MRFGITSAARALLMSREKPIEFLTLRRLSRATAVVYRCEVKGTQNAYLIGCFDTDTSVDLGYSRHLKYTPGQYIVYGYGLP